MTRAQSGALSYDKIMLFFGEATGLKHRRFVFLLVTYFFRGINSKSIVFISDFFSIVALKGRGVAIDKEALTDSERRKNSNAVKA